ncbi:MAG TPA: CCA tRNA nucleotidyltransferase [Dehalococcoidales bacterium]|nr:CCA tRNA nucleotidyltransferase [Dehalococcoidales bacterium]
MPQLTNLADLMEKRLPAELVEFMQEAGLVAAGGGQSLYLVGGVVRDLLLGRINLDLDLAVTGDAIAFARQLSGISEAKITTHPRFRTVKLSRGEWSVDIATVRSESYDKPGALPAVRPGTIKEDLFRRDFTINAMAVELTPSRWGRLIDLYGGKEDLKNGLIRILHEDSFIDDATRIWRALRYEQRLDFKLEPKTLRLLKQNIGMLETISGDRIRHELELVLKEGLPEKVIRRADKLGVLAQLYPGLKGDGWLARKFAAARKFSAPNVPVAELYLALLAYRLNAEEAEKLISRLKLSKLQARTLTESNSLKAELGALDEPILQPSCIYTVLIDYKPSAIITNYLATDSQAVKKNIKLFLNKLRNIKPALTGNDLQKMGIPPGPRMKGILHLLLEARLDGEVKDRRGEVELVGRS